MELSGNKPEEFMSSSSQALPEAGDKVGPQGPAKGAEHHSDQGY